MPTQPNFYIVRDHRFTAGEIICNLNDIEGVAAAVKIDRDDRAQHQQAANHCIDEELDCGVNPALASPHADQKIHRDQCEFEEKVEQKHIPRNKHTDHSCFEDEQEN